MVINASCVFFAVCRGTSKFLFARRSCDAAKAWICSGGQSRPYSEGANTRIRKRKRLHCSYDCAFASCPPWRAGLRLVRHSLRIASPKPRRGGGGEEAKAGLCVKQVVPSFSLCSARAFASCPPWRAGWRLCVKLYFREFYFLFLPPPQLLDGH
jgi:hypothetical protein